MQRKLRTVLSCGIPLALMVAFAPVSNAANLLIDGNFASSTDGFSGTQAPTGWTSIGSSDGVIADSVFGTPAYGGSTYYFDTGGFGDSAPASGDGIEQTVATSVGATYNLSLGLSNENYVGYGPEFLNVLVNGSSIGQYAVSYNSAYNGFQDPWAPESLSFVAGSTSSTIAFTVSGTNLGGQDPLLAGIDLESGSASPTPEPSSFVLLGSGILGLAGAVRRKLIA